MEDKAIVNLNEYRHLKELEKSFDSDYKVIYKGFSGEVYAHLENKKQIEYKFFEILKEKDNVIDELLKDLSEMRKRTLIQRILNK